MKLQAPYKCDECGEVKKTTNHWWLLLKHTSTNVPGFVESDRTARFTITKWEYCDPDSMAVEAHLCSESCASKQLSKWMAQRTNVKEPPECFASTVHQFSGPLALAVQAYLESRKPSRRPVGGDQVVLIRDYLWDWINRPRWDYQIETMERAAEFLENLAQLRESVLTLASPDEIERWTHEVLRIGLDEPLVLTKPQQA
jgi:hypothetical protein